MDIIQRVRAALPFEPTGDQQAALVCFARFVREGGPRSAMLLRGAAGTGKTTLTAAIVQALRRVGQKFMLLAPTGRAAKVVAGYSHMAAHTIHRKIYRERKYEGSMGVFDLADNRSRDMLFIVDEASMIAMGGGGGGGLFGSGCLLDDLISYVYSGEGCRLVLVGDRAQLPPVGETRSPALESGVVGGYGLEIYECELSEVVRQSLESGILWNATLIRHLITSEATGGIPTLRFTGFADIVNLRGGELIETLEDSYRQAGVDETMVVVRSNKRAKAYNLGIRATILGYEEELEREDMLMVVKNHYHVPVADPKAGTEGAPFEFVANGDRCRVVRVAGVRELYGFRFADVTLSMPDYDDYEWTTTVILDSLATEAPALTAVQQEQLWQRVQEDYAHIRRKAERIRQMKEDRHLGALQIKYAYAVTCHKAQGGQWRHVYLDQGYMTEQMMGADYWHWLYTAFTRATERLYVVNWPRENIE